MTGKKPGRQTGDRLDLTDPERGERIAHFTGIRLVVERESSYHLGRRDLSALDRPRYLSLYRERRNREDRKAEIEKQLKKSPTGDTRTSLVSQLVKVHESLQVLDEQLASCVRWRTACQLDGDLILAGDHLLVGGTNRVSAYRTSDGGQVWSTEITGRAESLAVAGGRLFVSTDQGTIICFSPENSAAARRASGGVSSSPPPAPGRSEVARKRAARILETTAVQKGYCLVIGGGDGLLAREIADRTDLHVVGIDRKPSLIERGRRALVRSGHYGHRVSLLHMETGRLPFSSYLFNLIIIDEKESDGSLLVPREEIFRLLRPCGGVAILDTGKSAAGETRELLRRGPLPGAGSWTRLYADPGHSTSSGDLLRGPLALQWFGRPGPRPMIDRHHRTMSPLCDDGRLFLPADNQIITLDQYNGTLLWELEVPDSRRIGVMKDSGQMMVLDGLLLIARGDECWTVTARDGRRGQTYRLPPSSDLRREWGYLDGDQKNIFGTEQISGTSFFRLRHETCDLLEGDHRPVTTCRSLFALDRSDGESRWRYEKGAILNSTIAIFDGAACFLESHRSSVIEDADGRIRLDEFCTPSCDLVSLSSTDGKELWRRSLRLPYQHILFLSGRAGVILLSGAFNESGRVYYELEAHSCRDGTEIWRERFSATDIRGTRPAPLDGTHGEQWQHPVIVGDTVYARPHAFDLKTGRKKEFHLGRGGHGCGGLTASAHYLFGRGDHPRMYPLAVKMTEGVQITRTTRPGCWINIIPAGGMVLIPESSSGCTCAYPIQTSLGFIPTAESGQRPED